jgi:hypothetical protein
MVARQEAWTVAETPIEALAVAAATGLIVEPDARRPRASTRNVSLNGIAPPGREGFMIFLSSAALRESLEIPVDISS